MQCPGTKCNGKTCHGDASCVNNMCKCTDGLTGNGIDYCDSKIFISNNITEYDQNDQSMLKYFLTTQYI